MKFVVEMLVNRTVRDNWGLEAELNNTRLRYELVIARQTNNLGIDDLTVKYEQLEKIKHQDDRWIKSFPPQKTLRIFGKDNIELVVQENRLLKTIEQNGIRTIRLRQDGTNKVEKGIYSRQMLFHKTVLEI